MSGTIFAPGELRVQSADLGNHMAHLLVRAATYRVIFGLPLGVAVLVGLLALLYLARRGVPRRGTRRR